MELEKIGKVCRQARERAGKYQFQVAQELNYTDRNISMFERGKVNNARILLWYMTHFFIIEDFEALEVKL